MQVVLLERIEKLGFIGSVVDVKSGYARNYLFPKKKAMRATKANLAYFETQRVHIEADNLKKKKDAEIVSEKMSGLCINVIRQAGDSGHLFGSVRNTDIAEEISKAGFTINKSHVAINEPIKMLGIYNLKVVLHPEVQVEIKVNVAQTIEEAEAQLEEFAPATTDKKTKEKVQKTRKKNIEEGAEEIKQYDV